MRRTIQKLWSLYDEARGDLDRAIRDESEDFGKLDKRMRQLRDRLVVNYSPLVKYAAGRISARSTSKPSDQEDLISWGILGLLDAVETFRPDRGAKFETYAISKIQWAILDEMRRMDPLPRRVRQRVREAQKVRGELAQALQRAPTEREVAEKLGVEFADHREFLGRYHQAQVWSLEASVEAGGELGWEFHQVIADHDSEGPEAAPEVGEMRARLVGAIEALGERERVVTTFYFYEGLTLREIGKALDLTEGRISQILRQSLIKLKGALAESPVAPDS
ncbi:MAG: FliA/WhiG family RNA polymerase sigma factor [Rubrobacter sp.]|nr:FliA/WhiG family RNA polymerase sigma factor [Rubrobacter sp.]